MEDGVINLRGEAIVQRQGTLHTSLVFAHLVPSATLLSFTPMRIPTTCLNHW